MAVTPSRVYLTGMDQVLKNLNKEVLKIKNRTKAGLWEAGLIVKNRSLDLTPVKTTHLRGSCYLLPFDSPGGPVLEIGYWALYAPYVHEIERYHHNPPTQWKFLETAIKENVEKILEIIRRRAHVDSGKD